MLAYCRKCVAEDFEHICKNCMVRGAISGWDNLPDCCKQCDYVTAFGGCEIFRTVVRVKDGLCGMRYPPNNEQVQNGEMP